MNPELIQALRDALCKRAESWRTNPDDSHGINTAVYIALLEVDQAIADALATAPRTGAAVRVEQGGAGL